MQKVNWGIIGLGNIAKKFSEGFDLVNNAKILSIASQDPYKLNLYKEKFNLKETNCYKNYEEMLENEDVDIIYISLPNSLHYPWILKCIKKNKKVLVEKPAVLNFNEIENIDKILEKNFFFAEAFMYRFSPQIQVVIDIIQANEIGDILSIDSSFGVNLLTKKKFFLFRQKKKINLENRLFNKDLGGGCILDLGCYPSSFSILIASLSSGKIEKIKFSDNKKHFLSNGVEVDAQIGIKFNNNINAKIRCSFKNNYGKQSIIIGNKGKIIIKDTWFGNEVIKIIENKEYVYKKNYKNIYSYEIENTSKAIINGENTLKFPGMTFEETKLNMKILDKWREN